MKIGIIGAMDVEVQHLKKTMKITDRKTVAGQEYCEGTIGNTPCVVVQCGVGKVRAAMSVQVLNDLFHVTHILNTGVAGSLNNDINIGDIVVSTDAVFHDVNATVFGYALGEIPQAGTRLFTADEALQKAAVEAVRNAAPDVQPFAGRIASGDQFISEKEKKQWIRNTFKADCCEMEGCAIAEAAYFNQLPFVIIRAISDKADESVTESYDEFEGKAAVHCARIVQYMLEHLQ
jgi:adenosylhomocysteine nucleosidase